MPDDQGSHIVLSPRNYADIASLQQPDILDQFLVNPLTASLEAITGAFAGGGKGLLVSAGRITQGLVKGQLYGTLADEIRRLREAGKLPPDLGATKHGLYTWAELMAIIDSECPDADRSEALKAAFYAVNKVGCDDEVLSYQLWQIAKRLTSGDVVLLKGIFENVNLVTGSSYRKWAEIMAQKSGFQVLELVDLHEKRLTDLHLITPRQHSDQSGITGGNGRLTTLGLRVCMDIQTYNNDLSSCGE